MALDALVDATALVGTLQGHDPPPAGFGLGRLARLRGVGVTWCWGQLRFPVFDFENRKPDLTARSPRIANSGVVAVFWLIRFCKPSTSLSRLSAIWSSMSKICWRWRCCFRSGYCSLCCRSFCSSSVAANRACRLTPPRARALPPARCTRSPTWVEARGRDPATIVRIRLHRSGSDLDRISRRNPLSARQMVRARRPVWMRSANGSTIWGSKPFAIKRL